MAPYPLLERINAPADLRALDRRDLDALATELRAFLETQHRTSHDALLARLDALEAMLEARRKNPADSN